MARAGCVFCTFSTNEATGAHPNREPAHRGINPLQESSPGNTSKCAFVLRTKPLADAPDVSRSFVESITYENPVPATPANLLFFPNERSHSQTATAPPSQT